MGPSYIEQCFRWAHEADPTAFLIYNDNKVEGMNGPNKAKADGFYNLLSDLISKGVPVHGAGMQAHFNAGGVGDRQRVPTPLQVKNQIRRYVHVLVVRTCTFKMCLTFFSHHPPFWHQSQQELESLV